MKPARALLFAAAFAATSTMASRARADDAGDASASDAEAGVPEGIQPTTTSDNWSCQVSASSPVGSNRPAWELAAVALALSLRLRSRRRRKLVAPLVAATLLAASPARAAPDGEAMAIDAPPSEPEPPMRRLAIYVNPLSLLLDRYGGSIELALASHHVIEAGAYYVYCATNSDAGNVFEGVGGELGYRLYLGDNGPRGFYVGPSFLLAALTAIPQAGTSIGYLDLGGALDIGYQALVEGRVLVGIGAGAQYTVATKSFPPQQVPASVYANDGLRPRLSLAIGVAF